MSLGITVYIRNGKAALSFPYCGRFYFYARLPMAIYRKLVLDYKNYRRLNE